MGDPHLLDETGPPTFSVSKSVSSSCRRCVKTMVNTAWERLLVSFILVAATVLGRQISEWGRGVSFLEQPPIWDPHCLVPIQDSHPPYS